MESWLTNMPEGMLLKSEGFASDLSDPGEELTLRKFCGERRLPYGHTAMAIPLTTFSAYGLAFRASFVPEVDERRITCIKKAPAGFHLVLDDGAVIGARQVVVAIGLHPFRHVPDSLAQMAPEIVSHSADHGELTRFARREVIVVGAGSSAVELAALLHERGATVSLVTRSAGIRYQPQPAERPLWRRALRPLSGIGYGWHSLIVSEFPGVFHWLPEKMREHGVQHYLMPAPGWFVRNRVEGKV
jgi:cation diffusion facilitator CzcD-associated flavoprotein CzcO